MVPFAPPNRPFAPRRPLPGRIGSSRRRHLRYNAPARKNMKGGNLNNLQVARLLFTSPTQAFIALREKPVFSLPMLLTLVFGAAVIAAYYSKVDIAWFNDQVLAPAARKMTAEQQQMMAS